jgi:hypothetical protein
MDYQQAQDPNDYHIESETEVADLVYEAMTEQAVADYLRDEGIPEKYCSILEGMYWYNYYLNTL